VTSLKRRRFLRRFVVESGGIRRNFASQRFGTTAAFLLRRRRATTNFTIATASRGKRRRVAMKRIVVALTLVGMLLGSTSSLQAGDWRYSNAGNAPQQDHPILKKVLIGAGLVGVGYLIGRLTAPKPGPVYGQPPVQIGPQPGYGHSWQHGHHGFTPGRAF
jgi:hypothetical protein